MTPTTETRQHVILIIDDQPANLSVLANHLEQRGFEVLISRSGENGLEKARFAHPDLILLDVSLPGIDGYEACRRLKAEPDTAEIPVIFITVYTDTEHKVQGFQAGGIDYITKPFQEQEIFARVTTHLRLRELAEQLEVKVRERTAELERVNQQLQQEILERKTAEEQVRRFNAELEQHVKERTQELQQINRELNNFAYVVSHDLKAPLRGVNQISRWLLDDYGDRFDAQGKAWLNMLRGQAKLLEKMVKGILDYSRVGRTQELQDAVDLNLILNEVMKMIAPPPHVQIAIDGKLPVVVANHVRLMQIFQNLIDNAVKFMDKPVGKIVVGCADAGEWWAFRVADNGPGIEQKYHEKIFEIFQTLSFQNHQESTGIGLSLVKKIVESSGGRIWLESTVGQGSTFFFTLKKAASEDLSFRPGLKT